MTTRQQYLAVLSQTNDQRNNLSMYYVNKKQLVCDFDLPAEVTHATAHKAQYDQFMIYGQSKIFICQFDEKEYKLHIQNEIYKFLEEGEKIIQAEYIKNTHNFGVITTFNKLHYFKFVDYIRSIQLNPYSPEEGDKKIINPHLIALTPRKNDADLQIVFDSNGCDQQLQDLISTFMVSSLVAVENGFLIGFTNVPAVLNYQFIGEEKLYFAGIYRLDFPNIYKVINMSAAPDEAYIAFAVQHTIKPIKNIIKDEQQYRSSHSVMLSKKSAQNNGSAPTEPEQEVDSIGLPVKYLGRIDVYIFNYGELEIINAGFK